MLSNQNRSLKKKSLEGISVLVTRPASYDEYLVSEIEKRGGNPIVLPTIEIEFIANKLKIELMLKPGMSRRIVIFTSRNAVAATAECIVTNNLNWPPELKCAAVGPKTAEAIRSAFRISDVLEPDDKFGVDGLMQLDQMQNLKESPVTVIDGGGEGSAKLLEMLRLRGSPSLEHHVVYTRKYPHTDTKFISEYLSTSIIDYVVITSVTGAANLFELIGNQLTEKLKKSCMVAYSQRIADYLLRQGFEQVIVTSESSDDAVVQAIEVKTV